MTGIFTRYSGDILQKNEMGGAHGMYGRQKRYEQDFGVET